MKYYFSKNITKILLLSFTMFAMYSCDFTYELPEAGSIADQTPPAADFQAKQNDADWLQLDFTNTSTSSTDYTWDFGDGSTSSDFEPSHVYSEEGTYTVTLRAQDKLNVSDEVSKEIVVEEPVISFTPVINEPGFEDLSLPDGTGDGRDSWRNDAGGVIQITSSPVYAGEQAAKLPSAGDRVGLQEIAVLPDTDYAIKFFYTMKTDPGTLTVAALNSFITDLADVAGATIESVALTDNSDANTYVQAGFTFNTGSNTEISIFFHNEGSECRIDDFTIEQL